MNDEVEVKISETAAAILQVQNRRWWEFWTPKITQDRMEQIIREALVGELEPMRRYLIGVDASYTKDLQVTVMDVDAIIRVDSEYLDLGIRRDEE